MNEVSQAGRSNTGYSHVNLTPTGALGGSLRDTVGIDMLHFRFPVEAAFARGVLRESSWVFVGDPRASRYRAKLVRAHDGTYWGLIAFNPSRWVMPYDWRCASVPAAMAAVEEVWEATASRLQPTCSVLEAEVKRLDVARDFEGISSPNPYLTRLDVAGLAAQNLDWAHYVSAKGGRSIRGWNGSGSFQLYDKHRESGLFAPAGTLRFEVQLRRWLQRYGMQVRTIEDITSDSVVHATRLWWERSGFGMSLLASNDAYTAIKSHFGEARNAAALANSAFGYLTRVASAISTDDVSPNSRRRYEEAIRASGFHLDTENHSGPARWLDLDLGSEVVTNA